MDCREYLEHFSEYADGNVGGSLAREMDDHQAACPRCSRYARTVQEGAELLRSLPALEVPEDFRARLDHRIFHVEDGALLARDSLASGATTLSILAVASLLALAAWAPFMMLTPTVELPALVVSRPLAPTFTFTPAAPTFPRSLSVFSSSGFQEGIWGDANTLLFEYSTLSERRRYADLARTGVQ